MAQHLDKLWKWVEGPNWRDAMDDSVDQHLAGADEFDLTDAELETRLGERMSMILELAFEDLLAATMADGSNPVDDYLARRGWKEGASTRAYLAALRHSTISLYDVVDVRPGVSFVVRDLVRGGEPLTVHEATLTRQRPFPGSAALRLVTVGGKLVMTGAILPLTPALRDLALAALEQFARQLDEEDPRPDLDPAQRLERMLADAAPVITAVWLEAFLDASGAPRLPPLTAEEMRVFTVRYAARPGVTRDRIAAAILAIPGTIEFDHFRWDWSPDPVDAPDRLLAEIEIIGPALLVTVNTRALAERAAALLAAPLAGLVGPPTIEEELPEPASN